MARHVVVYEFFFLMDAKNYQMIRNKNEKVAIGPYSKGYVCLWPYTSRLSAPQIWKYLGKKLLIRSMHDFRFSCTNKVDDGRSDVEISVLIGHRGLERLPLLLTTLRYISGQKDVNLECIVVEQDSVPRIKDHLPAWVSYFFLENSADDSSYNRSAAFNMATRQAKGAVLLLHDNDMLIPESYCKDILNLVDKGYDAINPKRFVFYLDEDDTKRVVSSQSNLNNCMPEYIVQNLEAGGSMAITRRGYHKIGGMDEKFVGWGGEDNEFWSRCSLLNRWIWGYAPVIHLWHKSQPLKGVFENKNVNRAKDLMNTSRDERIKNLLFENGMLRDDSEHL